MSTVREQFEESTEAHKMTVLHDDGLYRHIRFQTPGTGMYFYDLITWPGFLTIAGDCGTYTFGRTDDMFEFFKPDYGINPQYWGEKTKGATIKDFSPDTFRIKVLRWFDDAALGMEPDEKKELRAELDYQVLSAYVYSETEAHRLLNDFEHNGLRFEDAWEWELRGYTQQFLWCCWAILRGIERYKASKA